ncbi:MAG: hypothetical protein JSU96_06490 [Acidobacteriota bacterium]|nr:MAG: hypothetical protein JSU96_06490 [Acidobacteriota bacterium]
MRVVRLLLLFVSVSGILLVVTAAFGEGRPWIDKPPEHWTLQDAEAILWKSPWVGYKEFRFFNSRGLARDGRICARIQSARPIRLALALAFQAQPEPNVVNLKTPDAESVQEMAEQIHLQGEFVISIIAFPPSFHRRLDKQPFEQLQKETFLTVGSLKLPLQRYVPPKDTTFGEAWFRFARPEITSNTDRVQFTTRLRVPGKMKVSIDFDPAKLQFEGQVDY